MTLRLTIRLLSVFLSYNAIASDPKGKEELDDVSPSTVAVVDTVVMEEIPVAPETAQHAELEELVDEVSFQLELSKSGDEATRQEYRQHLKSSREKLEAHPFGKQLRDPTSRYGKKFTTLQEVQRQRLQRLESKLSGTLDEIDRVLAAPADERKRFHGLTREKFIELTTKAHVDRMKGLSDLLEFYNKLEAQEKASDVSLVRKNPDLSKDLAVLEMFEERVRYAEMRRKYLGDRKTVKEFVMPTAQSEQETVAILIQIIKKMSMYKPVYPDCMMENYAYDRCRRVLTNIEKSLLDPSSLAVSAAKTPTIVSLQDPQTGKTKVMVTSRTPEQLAEFKNKVETTNELAKTIYESEDMDHEMLSSLLGALQESYNEVLADAWYQKQKKLALEVRQNPQNFSADYQEASIQTLNFELRILQVIEIANERLGRL